MAKYLALRKMLISHMSMVVEEDQEFEAEFPEGMKLGDNLKLVEDEPAPASAPKGKGKATAPSGD
jgi:hypothetical protein